MAKKYNKIRLHLEYLVVRTLLWAFALFPLETSMNIGKWIGAFAGARLKRLNKIAHRNLELAMPDNSASKNRDIIRGTFETLGRHLGFISHFKYFHEVDIRGSIEIVGRNYLLEAHETGRGVLFFTGHFGSWEIFNLVPPAFGENMMILVRRIDNSLIEKYFDSLRTRFGTITVGKREGPRSIYKQLDDGYTVGIAADLNAQLHDGMFVDFFGLPACTTKSIAKFAIKTNAIILPAFALWEEEKQKYVVYLGPPLDYEITGDTSEDIRKITAGFTKVVENYVRQYPEQWLWIHKRWNTRPEGEAGLY